MSRLIALGDTHGRVFWKFLLNGQQYDKVIFLGDYWDSFNIPFEEQLKNFLNIVEFKRAEPEKVILLTGNHDYHYTKIGRLMSEEYSGYQRYHAGHIIDLMTENADLFQMAYLDNNHLFTHAGVTKSWVERTRGLTHEEESFDSVGIPIDQYINDVWKFKPGLFSFCGSDPFGDDVTQSPIWVRPHSLNEDAFGDYVQVVGHTSMDEMPSGPVPFLENGSGMFIDVLNNTAEALVIDDGINYSTIKL